MRISNLMNSLVFVDDTYPFRLYDGAGPDVQKFVSANQPCDASTGYWTLTAVNASTVANSATAGEYATITTAAVAYDGINMQLKGESFKLSGNKPFYFGAKVKVSDATNCDFLIGVCETLTALLKTSVSHGIAASNVEGCFFFKADTSTAVQAKTYKDGAETATASWATALDANYHIYEVYYDGQYANFYVDGGLVTKTAANLPDGDLTPSFNIKVGATAAARTMSIGWVRCIQVNS